MKWLITGGSGFIGFHTCSAINKAFPNDNIIIADLKKPSFKITNNQKFHSINLLNESKTFELIQQEKPNRIIHLVGVRQADNPLLMTQININACGILLEGLRIHNIPIDGFLVVGSAAQYGEVDPKTPPTEEIRCDPISFYGQTKYYQEKLALKYFENYKMPIICVRPANLIGPGLHSSFLIPRILRQFIQFRNIKDSKKRELKLFHTKAGRDFIDIRDVVTAFIRLFKVTSTRGETFNLGSNKLILIKEIISKIKDILKIDELRVIEEKPQLKFDLHLTNSNKIRSFINWEPIIDLETTLKDMIEGY